MRRPGECGGSEGHLQGQVRHPSVACGDTSPCRGGFWDGGPQKGSPARGAGCAGRRRLRGALPVGDGDTPQGLAGPFPAVHGDAARPRGGRDRPPYIATENGQRPVNGSRLQGPTAGRCKHRPLRRGVRQSGRILPPCFAGCVAAGRVRRPGRAFARSGAAPLRRLRRRLPLQGRLFRWRQHTERLPCKGSLSSSGLLKAASPVKGRRWRRLPYPSTVTSVRRTWPASQASRSRMQGAGRLPAVRSTRP